MPIPLLLHQVMYMEVLMLGEDEFHFNVHGPIYKQKCWPLGLIDLVLVCRPRVG